MPSQSTADQKQALTQHLAVSRRDLVNQKATLQAACDVKTQLVRSVKQEPTKWAIGSGVLGLLGTRLFKRRKSKQTVVVSKSKGGFISRTLSTLLIAAVKPLVLDYLKAQALRSKR